MNGFALARKSLKCPSTSPAKFLCLVITSYCEDEFGVPNREFGFWYHGCFGGCIEFLIATNPAVAKIK